jgi:hypothetical protein
LRRVCKKVVCDSIVVENSGRVLCRARILGQPTLIKVQARQAQLIICTWYQGPEELIAVWRQS